MRPKSGKRSANRLRSCPASRRRRSSRNKQSEGSLDSVWPGSLARWTLCVCVSIRHSDVYMHTLVVFAVLAASLSEERKSSHPQGCCAGCARGRTTTLATAYNSRSACRRGTPRECTSTCTATALGPPRLVRSAIDPSPRLISVLFLLPLSCDPSEQHRHNAS